MSKELLKATIIATGKSIEVYRHNDGSYVDFEDCKTKYQKSELVLPKDP